MPKCHERVLDDAEVKSHALAPLHHAELVARYVCWTLNDTDTE